LRWRDTLAAKTPTLVIVPTDPVYRRATPQEVARPLRSFVSSGFQARRTWPRIPTDGSAELHDIKRNAHAPA
jgi:hypothetical protein